MSGRLPNGGKSRRGEDGSSLQFFSRSIFFSSFTMQCNLFVIAAHSAFRQETVSGRCVSD
jgi:hypothetical protein